MHSSRFPSSDASPIVQEARAEEFSLDRHDGYQWTALSVTTVGALLASIQGSALLIALPIILGELHATFFSVMWVLLGYLLILTVLTLVGGRLADLWCGKRLYTSSCLAFAMTSV